MNGEYAKSFVAGMQGDQTSNTTYLKTSSCLKHFAAYSEESGRNSFAAEVSAQDMEDVYLPAFRVGIWAPESCLLNPTNCDRRMVSLCPKFNGKLFSGVGNRSWSPGGDRGRQRVRSHVLIQCRRVFDMALISIN